MIWQRLSETWCREWRFLSALALIGVGVTLRLSGLNWDAGALLHPDERYLILVLSELSWPDSLSLYFDSGASPLNPLNLPELNWYVYGTLPLFLAKLFGDLTAQWLGQLGFVVPYRLLASAADIGVLLTVFALGRRVFGYQVGVAGAVLYGLAVLPIQLAHFFTVDPFLNLFLMLALIQAVRLADTGDADAATLLGLWWGCAIASKISAVAFGPAILGAVLVLSRSHGWTRATTRGILTLLVTLLVFRLLQPYAFSGWISLDERFLTALGRHWELHSSAVWAPPAFQWLHRELEFPLRNMALWGLGVTVFIAGTAGAVLVGVETLKRLQPGAALVLLALIAPIGLVCFSPNPTLRYLLPTYPMIALLAAHFAIRLGERQGSAYLRHWPLVLVVMATLTWALAFSSIYRTPMTRIAASEWIHAQVPAGSVLAVEHWDDRLPIALPGMDPDRFRYLTLRPTDPETADKRSRLLRGLDEADYLVISSRRAYGSLSRLPDSFPLAIRYYELVFGNLSGFRLAAEFTSYPRLPGVVITDDGAEEAFTVYDHPRVLIFEKMPGFSLDRITRELAEVQLPEDARNPSLDARGDAAGLTPVTVDGLRAADGAQLLHLVHWVAILWLAGIAGNALSRHLWPTAQLPGRAVLLAFGAYFYAVGLGSGIWTPDNGTTLLLIALIAMALSALWKRSPGSLSTQRIWGGGMFWGVFGFFLIVRLHQPAIEGGERPMDFAILNAFLRTETLPPVDPWFAGAALQYHAWGQHFMAFVGRLGATPAAQLYNLAAAAAPALAAELFFWLLYQLTQDGKGLIWPALTGTLLVLFGGNLSFWSAQPWQDGASFMDFWNASRIVTDSVNEFPFWTAVFGDLHGHFIGMVFSSMLLAGTLLWIRDGPRLGTGILLALSSASLALTNPWATPVYAMVLILVTLQRGDSRTLIALVAVGLGAAAVAAPFWATPSAQIALYWVETPIGLIDGLIVFGPFIALRLIVFSESSGGRRMPWMLWAAALVVAVLAGDFRGLVAGMLILELGRLWRYNFVHEVEFQDLLALSGLLVLLGSELFTISDRMNTIFKYQFEAWILLALSSALVLAEVANRRWVAAAAGTLLLLGVPTSVYSLWAWWTNPMVEQQAPTLDGLSYLARRDPGEALAVDWLNRRPGQPALLEAAGPPYGPFARISSFTGLPALVGWEHHVWQHGQARTEIRRRLDLLEAAYRGADCQPMQTGTPVELCIEDALETDSTLERYGISYAILGRLERDSYGAAAGTHWEALGWRPLFRAEGIEIWGLGQDD